LSEEKEQPCRHEQSGVSARERPGRRREMTSGQQRQDDREGSRPGSERPPALPRTTEAPEPRDQQAIPALEHYRRKRNGDHRQRITLAASAGRQRNPGCTPGPLPSRSRYRRTPAAPLSLLPTDQCRGTYPGVSRQAAWIVRRCADPTSSRDTRSIKAPRNGDQRRVCVLRATFGKAARLSANDQPDPLLPEKGSFPGTASRLLLGGIVESRLAIRGTASGFALVSCLTARSLTLSSAASGQGVQGQEADDDDRRRDSDDGDGGGGYDHTAILASLFGVETRRRASSHLPVFGGATVAEVGAYAPLPGPALTGSWVGVPDSPGGA
jgi:hypothetical protein